MAYLWNGDRIGREDAACGCEENDVDQTGELIHSIAKSRISSNNTLIRGVELTKRLSRQTEPRAHQMN